jgi:hypothetical protein
MWVKLAPDTGHVSSVVLQKKKEEVKREIAQKPRTCRTQP